jgi:hypothetical protein
MSKMQRVFAGSVSRYVMENADCDVFVVKSPLPKQEPVATEPPVNYNVKF